MITVEDKEEIRRLFYLEHKSIRWIARRLGHSRKTVRKALADASLPGVPAEGTQAQSQDESVRSAHRSLARGGP